MRAIDDSYLLLFHFGFIQRMWPYDFPPLFSAFFTVRVSPAPICCAGTLMGSFAADFTTFAFGDRRQVLSTYETDVFVFFI